MSEDSIDKILEERGEIYGDAVGTHEDIGKIWAIIISRYNDITGNLTLEIPPHIVALCMASLKVIRASKKGAESHTDSFDDMEGYIRIARKSVKTTWDGPFNPLKDIEEMRVKLGKLKVYTSEPGEVKFECGRCGVLHNDCVSNHLIIHDEYDEYLCDECFKKENQKPVTETEEGAYVWSCDQCEVITCKPFELEWDNGVKETVCENCYKEARKEIQEAADEDHGYCRAPSLLPEKESAEKFWKFPSVEMRRVHPRDLMNCELTCSTCGIKRATDGEYGRLWYSVMSDSSHRFSGKNFCEDCIEKVADMSTMKIVNQQ